MTIVEHSENDRALIADFDGFGMFATNILYFNAEVDQLEALANVSTDCYQHLRYECNGASLFNGSTPLASWRGRDGEEKFSWGGVPIAFKGCQCSLDQGMHLHVVFIALNFLLLYSVI